MSNGMKINRPTHPGEVLRDELVSRGICQRDFCKKVGVSHDELSEVINGRAPVTKDLAYMLESALGIKASLWSSMQARYNMELGRG